MAFDDFVGGRPARLTVAPTSAVVRQVTAGGVFVAVTGASTQHLIGPCRGIKTNRAGAPLSVGAHVLLIVADEPWLVAVDE